MTLPGAIFRDPEAQAERFTKSTPATDHADVSDAGIPAFSQSGGKTLWEIREHVIRQEEIKRIAKLEHLDEIEELRLVLGRYCVAWGTKGTLNGIGL